MKECIVLIPVYREMLCENEELSLKNNMEKLRQFPICFIAPENVKTSYYEENWRDIALIKFHNWSADSLEDYNRLLMKPEFYEKFSEYNYMFILQLDGWLIKGEKELTEFLREGYDYIGAPWPAGGYRYCKRIIPGAGHSKVINYLQGETICKVGNGGVSLRKTESMISFFRIYGKEADKWEKAEDIFISFYGHKRKYRLRIPSEEIAERFSLEADMKEKIQAGNIPMAVHKWEKYYPELLDDLNSLNNRC